MIFITASRSFVGIEVARQLAAKDHPLRITVGDPAEARLFDEFNDIDVVPDDARARLEYGALLGGVDRIFLAPPATLDSISMQHDLIRAARTAGIKHLVGLSGISGDPDSQRTAELDDGERLIERAGIPFTFVRASATYQALTVYLLHVVQDCKLTRAFGKERPIAPVDARDLAAVAVASLIGQGHEGTRHCVTGPETLTFPELADKLSFATGVQVGPSARRADGRQDCFSKWRGWEAAILTELSSGFGMGDAGARQTIQNLTGRDPISFDDYAAEIATCCSVFKR